MKQPKLYNLAAILTVLAAVFAASATAQTPRLRATTSQVRTVLNRINSETATFRQLMDSAVPNGINGANREDRVLDLISDLDGSIQTMRSTVNSRRGVGIELTDLLDKAAAVDRFMSRNQSTTRNRSQWNVLKSDINTLARYYGVTATWGPTVPAGQASTPVYTGTDYQLRSLITRLESRTNTFKRQMKISLNNSTVDNTNREDSINAYVRDFENATDR
ncbi:MAG: hypothetical protein ABJA02_16845, partial [Acidobacteriota bacterium]